VHVVEKIELPNPVHVIPLVEYAWVLRVPVPPACQIDPFQNAQFP